MRSAGLALIPALVLVTGAWAEAAATGPGATTEPIERQLTRLTAELPGLTAAIVQDGELEAVIAAGMAEIAAATPAGADTLYPVFSIAKPWTGMLLAVMTQNGQIDPYAPIGGYLETGDPAYDALTPFQLATHSAGVRHYDGEAEARDPGHCETAREALEIFVGDPLLFAPGEARAYSSWGYVLLSTSLAARAEASFVALLQDEVLTPLGARAHHGSVAGAAQSYAPGPDGFEAIGIDVSCKFGAGGFYASAPDIALAHNRAVLGDLVAAQFKPLVLPVQEDGTVRAMGMSPGGSAIVVTWPQEGLTVALAGNAMVQDLDLREIAGEIAGLWRGPE